MVLERRDGPVAGRSVRVRRAIALAAAVGGGVVDVGYLLLILGQQTGIGTRIAFIAGFVAVMSALALTGAVTIARDAHTSQVLLLGSGGGFVGLGLVAIFSIGTALIFLGSLAWVAAGRRRVSGRLAVAAIVGSVAVLAAGLALTS